MLYETPDLGASEQEVLEQISELKQGLRYQLHTPRRWTGSLRRLAFARNLQGSNSIEGYDAPLDDVAAIAVGEEPLDAQVHTRMALWGYRSAMTYILQLAQDPPIPLNETMISSLHFMITGHELVSRPGRWRSGSIYVRNDASGVVVYEGAWVDQVPGLMSELVASLNQARQSSTYEPLITAAMAHLNLVMIHPFRDGNGRMARCMQTLMLADSGTLTPVFSSIEEYLGAHTQAYYDVLAAVGAGRWQPQRDARPWIRFCLTAHLRQATTLRTRIRDSERLWIELDQLRAHHGLPERVTPLLHDAALGLRVRNVTYRAMLTHHDPSESEAATSQISEAATNRDLKRLVELGVLRARGEKRGRYYEAGPQLQTLRERLAEPPRDPEPVDPFKGR